MLPICLLQWKVIFFNIEKKSIEFCLISVQIDLQVEEKSICFLGRWCGLVGEEGMGWYLSVQDTYFGVTIFHLQASSVIFVKKLCCS